MKWRKINNIIHRDFGYLFFGVTIVYALSGIALNHLKEWNPSYIVETSEVVIEKDMDLDSLIKNEIFTIFENFFDKDQYKSHYYPDANTLKIFMINSTLTINTKTKKGILENVSRRPVFYEVNFLHYNPNVWWTYFSDAYCFALILLAITGLFVIKGKKGIKGRGAWLTIIGIIIPIIYLFFL